MNRNVRRCPMKLKTTTCSKGVKREKKRLQGESVCRLKYELLIHQHSPHPFHIFCDIQIFRMKYSCELKKTLILICPIFGFFFTLL